MSEYKKQIIFHGGCNGCTQQLLNNGTDFCYNCMYFDADWSLPNLSNKPPSEAEIERKKVKLRHGDYEPTHIEAKTMPRDVAEIKRLTPFEKFVRSCIKKPPR